MVFPSQLQEDAWRDGGAKLLLGKHFFKKKKRNETMNTKTARATPSLRKKLCKRAVLKFQLH